MRRRTDVVMDDGRTLHAGEVAEHETDSGKGRTSDVTGTQVQPNVSVTDREGYKPHAVDEEVTCPNAITLQRHLRAEFRNVVPSIPSVIHEDSASAA
ncbi:MAG: hypothetical protein ABL907_09135 [Hyphomicrobium sp.]